MTAIVCEESQELRRIGDFGVAVRTEDDFDVEDSLRTRRAVGEHLRQALVEGGVDDARIVAPSLHAAARQVVDEMERETIRVAVADEAMVVVVFVSDGRTVRIGMRKKVPCPVVAVSRVLDGSARPRLAP